MSDPVLEALETARSRGATHAEVRIAERQVETVRALAGRATAEERTLAAAGVRVLVDGAWGFACAPGSASEEISNAAARACATARLIARTARGNPAEPAPGPRVRERGRSAFLVDPFRVAVQVKCDIALRCERSLRGVREIVEAEASLWSERERVRLRTLEGTALEWTSARVGARLLARARSGAILARRSFPSPFPGAALPGGYEVLESLDLEKAAARVSAEARAAAEASACPGGRRDLVIGGSGVAWLLEHTLAPYLEADRALGLEGDAQGRPWSSAGASSAARIASEWVHVLGDGSLGGRVPYDDEGIPAQRTPLLEGGVLVGLATTRDLARSAGRAASEGFARTAAPGEPPLPRAACLVLQPGEWTYEDLLAETRDGVLCDGPFAISVDSQGGSVLARFEMGWEIRDGIPGRPLRHPTIEASVQRLWRSCDAVANETDWRLWPAGAREKSVPAQRLEACHGASAARFRDVLLVEAPDA